MSYTEEKVSWPSCTGLQNFNISHSQLDFKCKSVKIRCADFLVIVCWGDIKTLWPKHNYFPSYFLILTWEHFFIALRKKVRGREGRREGGWEGGKEGERKRHKLAAFSYAPQLWIKPATWVCALIRNGTCDLLVYGTMLQPVEPSRPWHNLILYQ